MSRVFISYSRKDEAFARRLATDLDRLGADVWIDVDDIPPGMKWSTAIQQGLDTCEVMIVIISPESMASRNVEDEWQAYLDDKKPLIPVRWRPARVHFQLRRIQYIDFHEQDYDKAFPALYSELHRLGIRLAPLPSPGAPMPLPSPAPVPPARARRIPRITWAFGAMVALIVVAAVLIALLSEGDNHSDRLAAALDRAQKFSGGNDDWEPFEWEFDGVAMVLVPAGCFMMGSTDEQVDYAVYEMGVERSWVEGEQPAHRVCIDDPFWIDKYEVTNAQYKRCVGAGDCAPPGDPTYFDDPAYADHPVVFVDWHQARAYAEWVGGSLPNEAEWEYAARGPDGLVFPWGNAFDCSQGNFYLGCDSFDQTAPVGSFPVGTSWVGALDLSGNVWEWSSTIYQDYPYQAGDGREDPAGNAVRVLRGVAFDSYQGGARCANRLSRAPDYWGDVFGFRVVRAIQ
jgi:formylglycine-generating enzyme required for sulfatase activity